MSYLYNNCYLFSLSSQLGLCSFKSFHSYFILFSTLFYFSMSSFLLPLFYFSCFFSFPPFSSMGQLSLLRFLYPFMSNNIKNTAVTSQSMTALIVPIVETLTAIIVLDSDRHNEYIQVCGITALSIGSLERILICFLFLVHPRSHAMTSGIPSMHQGVSLTHMEKIAASR